MKIKKSLPAGIAMPEAQQAFCRVTGISYSIQMPGIGIASHALVGKLPLADWQNVKGYARLGMAQLESLSSEVLAGLCIAGFQHWELLDIGTLTAPEANAVMRTAHKSLLARMLRMLASISQDKAAGLPMLRLEWADFREEATADRRLRQHLDRIGPMLDAEMKEAAQAQARKEQQTEAAYQAVLRIQGHKGRVLAGGIYLSATASRKDSCKEYEGILKTCKVALRKAAADLYCIGILTDKQAAFLADLSKGRALASISTESREKIIGKLRSLATGMTEKPMIEAAIKALQDSRPLEVELEALAGELDRVSDAALGHRPIRSIADILRSKAAK